MRRRAACLRGPLVLLAIAAGAPLHAEVPQTGRYLPLYPGLYLDLAVEHDARDQVFRQDGERIDSAETTLAGETKFPETRLDAAFRWTFPLFESAQIPVISEQLWTARVRVGYARTETEGALDAFIRDTSDDESTLADGLSGEGSGLTDLGLQYGLYLWGSDGWREGQTHPTALLLLAGVTLPTGHYERDAPVSAGGNTFAVDGRAAFNARPWDGGFIDAALGYRHYLKNQDAAFGALAPSQQGDDVFWDASIGQRVGGGVYVAAFASGRQGQANAYENPRFSPNQPLPPNTVPASDTRPTAGTYEDDGTSLTVVGGSLSWFPAQRWLFGLHYTHPVSGESGEYDLPYTNRQPANCTPGTLGCTQSAGQTVHVDGLGAARSFASDRIALTLTYNFGQGDAYTCAGCRN